MTLPALQRALLGLVLLAPMLAAAENARLPYRDIIHIQQAQAEIARDHPKLALVLTMHSALPTVKSSDIKAYVDAKSGHIPVPIGEDGAFSVPLRIDLMAEGPWIVVNQPKGTMELNWHAGLPQATVRSLTNTVHYSPLMRTVRECDDVQDRMRPYFPAAPRLMTTVGLKVAFHQPDAAVIIHAKSGDRKLASDALGELIIPLDDDLLAEDPLMTLTATPVAVEVVTQKSESSP